MYESSTFGTLDYRETRLCATYKIKEITNRITIVMDVK
jgi:hypothetical protein